ncbi:MAG: triosephosphate isomerase-like protein [Piptocephalis tieghemiana]|nr:MAG: triosephosphate isomerase-like protein [Piptocephalis tieghemiana]
MSPRKFFVGGNWKMNGTKDSIAKLLETLNGADLKGDVDVVVAPPALYVESVRKQLRSDFSVAGQDCFDKEKGAFTGEWSPQMLQDVGASWVILGHSERRTIFKESDELVASKTQYALSTGLGVILCVGERLEEREAGTTKEVVVRQLSAVHKAVGNDWSKIVVAYEPVWAIGTGKVATSAQAQEAHQDIRSWVKETIGADAASALRIIYGGSVSTASCNELSSTPDVDGFLVGGASLKPDFIPIINARF